jgi:hypothetical protein
VLRAIPETGASVFGRKCEFYKRVEVLANISRRLVCAQKPATSSTK